MHLLRDSQLQRGLDLQSIAVCLMPPWLRAVRWSVRRELPIWKLSFPEGQFDMHWYVLLLYHRCLF